MLNKSVPIVLADGKTHNIRFDYNALCALEDEFKISIADLGVILSGPIGLKQIRAILWAGLLHENESLTAKDAGALIEVDSMAQLAEAISNALSAAFGTQKAELKKEPGPEPKNPGIGANT